MPGLKRKRTFSRYTVTPIVNTCNAIIYTVTVILTVTVKPVTMARKTAEQERADYFKFKIAYVFLLTPCFVEGVKMPKQETVIVLSKTKKEAEDRVKKEYPDYMAQIITITPKILL